MGILTPRPSEVIRNFAANYAISPLLATDYYYDLSRSSDYIRTYRVSKDLKWAVESEYGDIDITVNLSKPEKDPKAIAAAKLKRHKFITPKFSYTLGVLKVFFKKYGVLGKNTGTP